MGLYTRALEIRRQSQVSTTDNTISAEEQSEIAAEIDQKLESNRSGLKSDFLTFRARKRGAALPAIINVVAAVLLVGLVPLLFFLFDAQEDSLVQAVQAPAGAEGQLLAALREEAERRLQEKDREIEEGLTRVEALQAERDRLRLTMADRIRAREEELEAELQARLAREAERLSGRLDQDELQQRLAELEGRLRERFDRQLATFADREESEVEEQAAELERQIQARTRDLELAQAEVARLASASETPPESPVEAPVVQIVSTAVSFTNEERLAMDQVRGGYGQVATLVNRRDFPGALNAVERIQELLDTPAFASSESIEQVAELERATAATLREVLVQAQEGASVVTGSGDADRLLATVAALTDQADRRLRSGDVESAENLYVSALAEIPAAARSLSQIRIIDRERSEDESANLRERLAALEATLETARADLGVAEASLADYQEEERRRLEEIRALDARVEQARIEYRQQVAQTRAIPEIMELLSAKAELKEALDSPAVRGQYPDLYQAMEDYLEQVGALKEHEGEQAALTRVLEVLSQLVDGGAPSRSSDLFDEILSNLEELVRLR